jgi:deazaflavin-dependent oxidoreductase (nitroreductase family)
MRVLDRPVARLPRYSVRRPVWRSLLASPFSLSTLMALILGPATIDSPHASSSPRTRLHLFAPLSTRVFNPLTRLVAGRLPGLGVLTHTGRRTRRRYRTPLLVLRRGDDYVVALWYGSDVHWVKNVLVAGGCELRTRGRDVRLAEPRLSADPARRILPRPLRWAGSVVGLTEFLRLRAVGP